MKRKIFIGSSKESVEIAEQIKTFFSEEYDCVVWKDRFFQLNQSTYDTLVKKSVYFDYAIFVGGKDDFVRRYSNNKTKKAARDNVYFELGLYTGILSKERTFFFVHKEVKIATDLLGITVIQYEQPTDVLNGCQQVREKIKEEDGLNRITLLPSTSLAINYYKNFLEPLAAGLSECNEIQFEENKLYIRSWSIQIVIPQNCNEDWRIWANEFYKYRRCGNVEVMGKPRKFSIKTDADEIYSQKKLKIIDVPQILRGSFDAVEMVAEKSYIGYTDEITYMKEKEVMNFIQALYNLIEGNPLLRNRIKIFRTDDYDIDMDEERKEITRNEDTMQYVGC